MVLTQLQLKWPNHSTHLLTGLKALFKNEQLVDCTLKCNKHSLKVHRSVLAACSPYFERELENNPSIVVKDVQFNVLQALIEFMYYGETRISEENLTALIEAAKLFEVKGLSEMDLLASNENSVISSVVATNGNCSVKSSSDRMENLVFDSNTQPLLGTTYKNLQQSMSSTISSEDSEDSNSNFIGDLKDPTPPHTCRNFVVTPPQTESAQILLSLARSYNEKQQQQFQQITSMPASTSSDVLPNAVFGDQNFISQLDEAASSEASQQRLSDKIPIVNNTLPCTENKSLLAKLLTRSPTTPQTQTKSSRYYENYKNLYECESSDAAALAKNQNEADMSKGNFSLQPDVILDYPFLIQTNDGYVDVSVNMLNVFDNGEVFDPSKAACKGVPKANALPTLTCVSDYSETKVKCVDDSELERIKRNTEDELKDDPEAVVLCKVNEHGQVEKYVLSSSDINALKAMNEQLKLQRTAHLSSDLGSPHIEVEMPTSGNSSLITRIFSGGEEVENAISKLPFKKTTTTESRNRHGENVNERLLEDASSLTVDAHHHENMFEELDSQFSMDCSIENIQREYGAYEEASKNETQLEHNYYANAMKDEDEECVAMSENYDLRSVMLIEEPTDGDLSLMTLSNNNNNNKRKGNANTSTSSSSLSTFQIFSTGTEDVYLNGEVSNGNGLERTARRNGIVEKQIKCDLIMDTDALVSSVLRTVMTSTTPPRTRATNGETAKNVKKKETKRRNSVADSAMTLPFKKVKSAAKVAEKKPRRTYRRRSTSDEKSVNGGLNVEGTTSNLVEIIVDEVV